MSAGSHASNASRSSPASAGARPSVEIAIVTPPRRTTPPAYAVACAGSSTAFTNTRRDSAAARTCRLTSGGAAATTHHAPSRSFSANARRCTTTPAFSSSGRTSGATTVTSAPAASSASSFPTATRPPPTRTTRRDRSFRNAGNTASGLRGQSRRRGFFRPRPDHALEIREAPADERRLGHAVHHHFGRLVPVTGDTYDNRFVLSDDAALDERTGGGERGP